VKSFQFRVYYKFLIMILLLIIMWMWKSVYVQVTKLVFLMHSCIDRLILKIYIYI